MLDLHASAGLLPRSKITRLCFLVLFGAGAVAFVSPRASEKVLFLVISGWSSAIMGMAASDRGRSSVLACVSSQSDDVLVVHQIL
jgi:hypothetical protein